MRRGALALAAAVSALLLGCGGSEELAIEPAQLEDGLRESLTAVGIRPLGSPSVECEPPEGDGIGDPWSCVAEAPDMRPVSEETGTPGTQIKLVAFVLDDEFGPPGAFTAVQTGGDRLNDHGLPTGTFGCCIEDADLGTPEKYLD